MANAWMRKLVITLSSDKLNNKLVFGSNKNETLSIECVGSKYLSALKDTFTIKIKNLTYSEILQIISGEYYNVKIECGYENSSLNTIFDGGVLYVSNALDDTKTNTVIILCASKLVARYGQSRMNLSLTSGINLYAALQYICQRAGIKNAQIANEFKSKVLTDIETVNDTVSSYLENFCLSNQSYAINADSSTGAIFSLYDAASSIGRSFNLNNNQINLTGGYPRLTTEGVELSILPTFNFMCGDTITLDNSLFDLSVTTRSEISKNYGYSIDKQGQYIIYQLTYNLQNRGSNFSVDIRCKSRTKFRNIFSSGS